MVRAYLIPGFLLGFIVGYIVQTIFPQFLLWEFERYNDLRAILGAPASSYTNVTGIVLRLYFHLFHALIGGFVGFLIFHFRYRDVGYIIPLSKKTKVFFSIIGLLLFSSFIRIDLFDQFLSSQQNALTQAVNALSFLRSMFAPPTIITETDRSDEEEEGDSAPATDGKEQEREDNEIEGIVRPPEEMGTPQEIYEELNRYRRSRGLHMLIWNNKLENFAQSRASTSATQGGDDHRGFDEFLQKQNGFEILGFDDVAENSAYLLGSQASAKRIITEYFAESREHDANQLEATFTHVGVGVSGISVDVIFGGQKR